MAAPGSSCRAYGRGETVMGAVAKLRPASRRGLGDEVALRLGNLVQGWGWRRGRLSPQVAVMYGLDPRTPVGRSVIGSCLRGAA